MHQHLSIGDSDCINHILDTICFCLTVEASRGTCSVGSIRKSLSVVGQGPLHLYSCGWRQTGIPKWYILLGNARCGQRGKKTALTAIDIQRQKQKGRHRQLVQQYCCSQIQEMGENCIMSFITFAANRILEAKMKDIQMGGASSSTNRGYEYCIQGFGGDS